MRSTLTRSEIAQAVHLEIGLSRNESSKLVEDVLEKMTECFVKGENVKLSSFGTFSVRSKKERIGRNPKTGIEARISSRRVLSFHPSISLRKRVNK
jgi:integration host factor subunit alpha|tara:strand:+ start:568 stop:855 length:288 start_codon:yes stop_codon:yes gene_type:complete